MRSRNFFQLKFQKMPLKTRIFSSFIIILLLVSIIPILFISLSNSQENVENETLVNSMMLNSHCDHIASEFTAHLSALRSSFRAISDHSDISEILGWVANNSTLQDEFANYSYPTNGDFYPQRINHTEIYQKLYANFETLYYSNLHISAIRLFSKDGNLIVGMKFGEQAMKDYKGGRQWFKNALEFPVSDVCYMSPISLNQLNTPALRFYKPIVINGTIEGIFHIHYDAPFVLDAISSCIQCSQHYTILIDSNFEDTITGEFLGEMYVLNTLDNRSCFNVSTAGQIEFKVAMFETLAIDEIGTIILNGDEYYFSWQKVSFNQREWHALHLSLASDFTKSADSILRNNMIILFIVLVLVAAIATSLSFYFSGLIARSDEKVEQAELETEKLRRLLPICASCKKIRDKENNWHQIDSFLTTHERIDFTHGLCPDCIQKLYPNLMDN